MTAGQNEMSHTLSSTGNLNSNMTRINADMLSNAMYASVILDCSESVLKHSRGIWQTPHAPQADEADTKQATDCFKQTLLTRDLEQERLTGITCLMLCLRRYQSRWPSQNSNAQLVHMYFPHEDG